MRTANLELGPGPHHLRKEYLCTSPPSDPPLPPEPQRPGLCTSSRPVRGEGQGAPSASPVFSNPEAQHYDVLKPCPDMCVRHKVLSRVCWCLWWTGAIVLILYPHFSFPSP